jgi:ribonuclease-3
VTQSADLAKLETALGHKFARPELLLQAIAHRSQTHEQAMKKTGEPDAERRADNERLEFLGDAVLELVVSEALFLAHPDWQEGELTRLRAQLVNRQYLAEVASAIGLGNYLRLSRERERSGGRNNAYILANAMEAVIAAIFLDSATPAAPEKRSKSAKSSKNGSPGIALIGGSLDSVRAFAHKHILGTAAQDFAEGMRSGDPLGNFKSALQEHLQATHSGIPMYLVVNESGPDHRKRFQVEIRLRSTDGQLSVPLAKGSGSTKKKAEQEAARKALANLTQEDSIASPGPVETASDETEPVAVGQQAAEEAAKV